MLKNNPLIELASHTFSHYYALEEGQTITQFESDIRTAKEENKKIGLILFLLFSQEIRFPANTRKYVLIVVLRIYEVMKRVCSIDLNQPLQSLITDAYFV